MTWFANNWGWCYGGLSLVLLFAGLIAIGYSDRELDEWDREDSYLWLMIIAFAWPLILAGFVMWYVFWWTFALPFRGAVSFGKYLRSRHG